MNARRFTRLAAVAVLAGLVSVVGLLPAGTAGAAPSYAVRFQPKHSGLCLSVQGASAAAGAPVVQSPCNVNADEQYFTAAEVTRLRPYHASWMCLVPKGGSILPGTPIVQMPCQDTLIERWTVAWPAYPYNYGFWLLRLNADPTKCLSITVSSSWWGNVMPQPAVLGWCTDADNMLFKLTNHG